MEIPSKIRFDFLLFLIGVGFIVVPFYLNMADLLKGILGSIGSICSVLGIAYIKYDFDLYDELRDLEYAKQKSEYLEYFKTKKYVNKKSIKEHEKDIRDMVNK